MEKKHKASQHSKTDSKSKKLDNIELEYDTITPVEASLLVWNRKAKEFNQFPFLDKMLFSEYLNVTPNATLNHLNSNNSNHDDSKLQEALKYTNVIKYIEKFSDAKELDALLHNIAFVYNIDKETLKKEALSSKILIQKTPSNMSVELYFKELMEDDEPSSPSMMNNIEIFIPLFTERAFSCKRDPVERKKKTENNNKANGIDLKEISSLEDLGEKEKKLNKQDTNGVSRNLEKALERQVDGGYPVKKKLKDDNLHEKEVAVPNKLDKKKKKNGETKKEKSSKKDDGEAVKRTRRRGKDDQASEEKVIVIEERDEKEEKKDGKVKEKGEDQYMEFQINNDVDSDDGENFSFFYVDKNVYNKTQTYFDKKLRPSQICSCVGGCNDPSICPCARYNFDMGGRTTCYVYDNKWGRKKLLSHLIKQDMHVYECSDQCACSKGLCLNSCVNEGPKNRCSLKDFIIERYRKTYQGTDSSLKNFSATMWGLKTKVFIPANAYIMEYCGEVITKKEGDRRGEKYDSVNCNYLFDLNKHAEIEKIDESTNTIIMNIDGVCETRNINKLKDIAENFPLVIDAFFYGNHARFVNHSCAPNMVALAVHVENRNILLPRIIFVALKDIQPDEELTIDYNCAPLKDLKNTEQLPCLCGASTCRGFVYEEAHDSDG